MIRNLIQIGLVLLAGILVYNYFFGSDTEREQSRQIFGQMRGLAASAVDLAKSEKEKFDHGKYDKALDQLGGVYRGLREKAQYLDGQVIGRLDELEQRKTTLQRDLDQLQHDENTTAAVPSAAKKSAKSAENTAEKAALLARRKATIQRELDKLARETEQLATDAERGVEK